MILSMSIRNNKYIYKQTKVTENMKKLVGKVTEEEKNEILGLYERRNGLAELAKVLDAGNEVLYEKLVKDMGETATRFQGWWNRMAYKYHWEHSVNGKWEIDFSTNEIYLCSDE